MAITHGTTGYRQVTLEARIIRADGTVEELGVISYWHRNPFKRLAWRLRRILGLHRKETHHDR